MARIAFTAAIALGALSVSTAQAQAPAPAPAAAPYEIVHPGDSQMSCDAMAKEIAGLGAEMQAAKTAAAQKQVADAKAADRGRIARGLGGALFSQAAAFGVGRIPGGGLLAQAASVGSQAIATGGATPAQAGTVAAAPAAGPEQRQGYLMSLFKSKSC